MLKFFLSLIALLPGIFMAVGAGMAYTQHRRISTFVPVQATVLGSHVAVHTSTSRGHTNYSYTPLVEYRYSVGGNEYTCQRVTPIEESGGQAWADAAVAQFPDGSACRAWYNPADPGEAFLLRQYSFSPYFMMLFPMLFIGIVAVIAFGTNALQGRSVPAPQLRPDKWLAVRPLRSIDRRVAVWTTLAGGWYGVGILVAGHYFWHATRPYASESFIASGIYASLGVALVVFAIYYRLLRRNVGEARVLVDRAMIACGQPFNVRIEQAMRSPLLIEELKVGLVCEASVKTSHGGKTSYSTEVRHQEWATLLENRSTRLGEVVSASHSFTVPDGGNPSSPSTFKGYPFYSWKLRVVNRLAGSPDYRGDFAIFVSAQGPVAAEAQAGAGQK